MWKGEEKLKKKLGKDMERERKRKNNQEKIWK